MRELTQIVDDFLLLYHRIAAIGSVAGISHSHVGKCYHIEKEALQQKRRNLVNEASNTDTGALDKVCTLRND